MNTLYKSKNLLAEVINHIELNNDFIRIYASPSAYNKVTVGLHDTVNINQSIRLKIRSRLLNSSYDYAIF